MQLLIVWASAQGYFIAPDNGRGMNGLGQALRERVSPFYADHERAQDACAEKNREYNDARAE
jgi:hypothetical protein